MSGSAADFPLLQPVLIEPIGINGATPPAARSFSINTSFEPYRRDAFRHRSIAAQRESIDLTDLPGEGTVNTEGLWRRGATSWHHGSGQLYADRKTTSDPYRYLTSKGIDPWTENQLGLLPDTTLQVAATSGQGIMVPVVCGEYVYVLSTTGALSESPAGSVTFYDTTSGWGSVTTPTGLSGTPYYIASDGSSWVAVATSSGVYGTTPGTSTWTLWVTSGVGAYGFLGYANGKWLLGNGAQLYDITGLGNGEHADTQIPSAITPPGWIWTGCCSGEGYIYLSGCAINGTSLIETQGGIYAVGLNSTDPTNTVLAGPFLALPLPNGEIPQGIFSYDNFIFIGTTLGVRMCSINNANDPTGQQGQLTSGPRIPSPVQPLQPVFHASQNTAVRAFCGFDRFVWWNWDGYDGTSSGLGRLDLSTLLNPLQPAYASDLMVSGASNDCRGMIWDPITNGPAFAILASDGSSGGLYTQKLSSGNPVAVSSGTLNSGRLTWGIPDHKLVAQANYNTAADGLVLPDGYTAKTLGGSVAMSVIYDAASSVSLTPLAPNTQQDPPVLVSPLTSAEEIQILLTLSSASSGSEWVFLTRWTAKALPQVVSGVTLSPVLMMYGDNVQGDQETFSDNYGDYAFLEGLRLSQTPLIYKEGSQIDGNTQYTAVCVVEEIDWLPFKQKDTPDGGYVGDCVLYLRSLVG